MSRFLVLPALLATTLLGAIGQASPLDSDRSLHARDNKWKLKCSNAPEVVAGNQPNLTDLVLGTALPPSGSNQEFMKYLWCTIGTKTYTYFGFGKVTGSRPLPYYNFYEAYVQAAIEVNNFILANGADTHLHNDKPGYWTLRPANTNVEIWVQSSVGQMTYGILGSALRGLTVAAANYNKVNYPMVFQINDGGWGEVGIGYAGILDSNGQCYYQLAADATEACQYVSNGWVKGFN